MSARLWLCLIAIAGLAACNAEDRSALAARPVTTITIEHGLPSLEAQARLPFYVLMLPDETATIWRADDRDFVTVDVGEIGSALRGLSAAPVDPLLLFAEHDPPAGQMVKVAKSLKDQGFSSVALVTPSGWLPPVPADDAVVK